MALDIYSKAGADAKFATAAQGAKADSAIQSVPDAAAGTKGLAQLAGDLGGTADAPTVTGGTHHGHTAAQVSDSTAAGRAVLTAADAAAQRAALGLAAAPTALQPATPALLGYSGTITAAATVTQGLYARTRPTPDNWGTAAITPLAIQPGTARMWSQGSAFAQMGYGPVDGSAFTAIGSHGLPASTSQLQLRFSSTHTWTIMGPMTAGAGSVWRSPLPNATITTAYNHGLSFVKKFDLAAPPGGITIGTGAYFRNSSLAFDTTGQRVMLLEYGGVITEGPSAYFSADAGETWAKVKTWAGGKHGHSVQFVNDTWWVQIGDSGFADIGLWTAPNTATPTLWTRRSIYGEAAGGNCLYGLNLIPVTVGGHQILALESDTQNNHGPLFFPAATPVARTIRPSVAIPPAYMGTMRQMTYDATTGNLYWFHTSEGGTLNTTDSIWMMPPPYTTAILLESVAYTVSQVDTLGDPVISGDYLWLGRNRVSKELVIGQ